MSQTIDEIPVYACSGAGMKFDDGTIYITEAAVDIAEDIASETKVNASGTGKELDTAETDATLEITIKFARLPLPALQHAYGYKRTVDEDGVVTLSRLPGSRGKDFELRGISATPSGEASNVEVVYAKCRAVGKMPVNLTSQEFAEHEMKVKVVQMGTGVNAQWADLRFHPAALILEDLFAVTP